MISSLFRSSAISTYSSAGEGKPAAIAVPASGFYEWRRIEGAKKQPWYSHRADGLPTQANEPITAIHDRMPVVLEPKNWKTWLEADPGTLAKMLVPADKGILDMYPVSTQVNNARYQGSNCIEQVE